MLCRERHRPSVRPYSVLQSILRPSVNPPTMKNLALAQPLIASCSLDLTMFFRRDDVATPTHRQQQQKKNELFRR